MYMRLPKIVERKKEKDARTVNATKKRKYITKTQIYAEREHPTSNSQKRERKEKRTKQNNQTVLFHFSKNRLKKE